MQSSHDMPHEPHDHLVEKQNKDRVHCLLAAASSAALG
jgi:hypothetical protein